VTSSQSAPSARIHADSAAPDIRLVAVDMDGTLLDEHGRVPDGLWPLLDRLRERGILFAPASGRQYATLRREFGAHGDDMVFIAENGTYVVRDDEEVSSDVLAPEVVAEVVGAARAMTHDVGVVLCGKRSAYIERTDAAFRAEADRYYARLEQVSDLDAVDDDIIKVAVFAFGDAETEVAPDLERFRSSLQVVVSGEHWADVMNRGVNKGRALRSLQDALGVTAAQTVVFGDYLNDLEMMDAADHSYAMANAHPDVAARARHRAPSNREHGVVRVLEGLLAG
jgi:Cof subfamily protein (haloacid dehalogenase superfamily)